MPQDMELVSLPDGSDTQAGWEAQARQKKFWSKNGRRLAHIFNSEWATGTFKAWGRDEGWQAALCLLL